MKCRKDDVSLKSMAYDDALTLIGRTISVLAIRVKHALINLLARIVPSILKQRIFQKATLQLTVFNSLDIEFDEMLNVTKHSLTYLSKALGNVYKLILFTLHNN